MIIGVRGKAIVTEEEISTRSVCSAAIIIWKSELCLVSGTTMESKPRASSALTCSAMPPSHPPPNPVSIFMSMFPPCERRCRSGQLRGILERESRWW